MDNKIKKYLEFIKESSAFSPGASFGYSDLSTINTGGAVHPKDPVLSFNSWDMHKNNLRDRLKRLSNLNMNIFSTGTIQFSKELDEYVQDLTIVRIFKNNNGLLDIYVKFFYDEEVYYGCFKNWGGVRKPEFDSKILNVPEVAFYKTNKLKIENIIKRILKNWFIPESGEYRALKEVPVKNWIGKYINIPKGGKIEVLNVITEDDNPIIELKYSSENYRIDNLDYYYFNWWFKSIEKREYYI